MVLKSNVGQNQQQRQALDGKTPAESARLDLIKGKNKWIELLKLACKG
jgi:hypothetical protein